MFTDNPIETGISEAFAELVAAQPAPAPTPEPSLPAITFAGSDLITPSVLGLLAREIAWDINEVATLIKTFKLSQEQFDKITSSDAFQQMVDAERIIWAAANNTEKRLKIEAATALERALPVISGRMVNQFEDLNHVVAAGKLLQAIAGIGSVEGAGSGQKFSITIDLGGDTKLEVQKAIKTVEAPAIEHVA